MIKFGVDDHKKGGQALKEGMEVSVLFGVPAEGNLVLQQVDEGLGELGEMWDEILIVSDPTQEYLDIQ